MIDEHLSAGREFVAAGVRSFVREHGDGDPVVCLQVSRHQEDQAGAVAERVARVARGG